MRFAVLGLSVLIGVSGCATATTPIPVKDAQYVPSDRVFRTEQGSQEDNAKALFVRDVGFTGGGVYLHLFIDGIKAASLNPGEKVEFVLPAGEHIFGVVPTDPFKTHLMNTIDQELKAEKQYFYRLRIDGNTLKPVVQRFIPEIEEKAGLTY
ncbi:MAG: hypothetical protein OEV28_07390 [Nitrospirota bacterium]|nr:hypothetical protein [Nitrospirota bacterium]